MIPFSKLSDKEIQTTKSKTPACTKKEYGIVAREGKQVTVGANKTKVVERGSSRKVGVGLE